MDREAWGGYSLWSLKESDTTVTERTEHTCIRYSARWASQTVLFNPSIHSCQSTSLWNFRTQKKIIFFFFFYISFKRFIYFLLFGSGESFVLLRLSLVAESRGYFSLKGMGSRACLLQQLHHVGSVITAHRLSSWSREQGFNPCPLH